MSKIYPAYVQCHDLLHDTHSHLMGKVLTIIDATFSDPVQRKAVKDLIKSEFNDSWINEMRDIILSQFKCAATACGDKFGEGNHVDSGSVFPDKM